MTSDLNLNLNWNLKSVLKMLNVIILRGLPGNGKTFLRKMLVLALEKMGKKVRFVSKDVLRAARSLDYKFTAKHEAKTLEQYRFHWEHWAKTPDLDVLISDNTNIRLDEIKYHFFVKYAKDVHFVVIQIGDACSDIRDEIPVDVQARMRSNMIESDAFLDAMLTHEMGQLVQVEPRTAIEEGIKELLNNIIV